MISISISSKDVDSFGEKAAAFGKKVAAALAVATAYGCRAWVNFNGTGTVAIRASGKFAPQGDSVPEGVESVPEDRK